MSEDGKRISIPQSTLVGILGLLVGGAGGGIVAPWRVDSSLTSLTAKVDASMVETAELRANVKNLELRIGDLADELRDVRRGRPASLVTDGLLP